MTSSSNYKRSYNSRASYNSGLLYNSDSNVNQDDEDKKDDERKDEISMAEFYCYEGLRNGGTFKVDSTTANAIKADPSSIKGKVVTLTGNYTVGYGSSGDNPLGFVEQVEKEGNGSDSMVVSVVWNQSQEDVTCAGTETAGSYMACDGSGGLALSGTSSAPVVSSAVAYGVDATGKTCTVYIHG